MTLPAIFEPSGLPAFLAGGHANDPSDLYATIDRGTGHRRKRRLYTVGERRVQVSRLLTPAQMVAYDLWFEETIVVGETHFSASVAKFGAGQEWWDACWLGPYNSEPIPTPKGIHWKMTGELLLTGEPSDTRPEDGALGVEYVARLTGGGLVAIPIDLGVEYLARLSPATVLGVEYEADLLAVAPRFLLIGSGFRLLIGSGKHLRIG